MITNVLATLIVMVVTNVYAPKQYLDTSYGCLVMGCRDNHSQWRDVSPYLALSTYTQTRDNPDVRIVEVREIKKWRFNLEGVPDHVISDKVLKKMERRRTVKQEETWTEKELELPIDWSTATGAMLMTTNNFGSYSNVNIICTNSGWNWMVTP